MAGRNGNGRSGGTAQKEKGSPPVFSRKYWTGSGVCEIAVFENTDGDRVEYSVTCKKTYKDGDEYKESKSFFQQELPLVAAALNDAFVEIQRIRESSQ